MGKSTKYDAEQLILEQLRVVRGFLHDLASQIHVLGFCVKAFERLPLSDEQKRYAERLALAGANSQELLNQMRDIVELLSEQPKSIDLSIVARWLSWTQKGECMVHGGPQHQQLIHVGECGREILPQLLLGLASGVTLFKNLTKGDGANRVELNLEYCDDSEVKAVKLSLADVAPANLSDVTADASIENLVTQLSWPTEQLSFFALNRDTRPATILFHLPFSA